MLSRAMSMLFFYCPFERVQCPWSIKAYAFVRTTRNLFYLRLNYSDSFLYLVYCISHEINIITVHQSKGIIIVLICRIVDDSVWFNFLSSTRKRTLERVVPDVLRTFLKPMKKRCKELTKRHKTCCFTSPLIIAQIKLVKLNRKFP